MYKTILVPVDLSHAEHGRETLKTAREIGGSSASITVLFVASEIPGYVAAELPEGLLQRNVQKAAENLKAIAAEAQAKAMVKTGHPSTTILETAKEIGADLIVVASHRPGIEDYFLGSTASRVVRHSACSVLVDR